MSETHDNLSLVIFSKTQVYWDMTPSRLVKKLPRFKSALQQLRSNRHVLISHSITPVKTSKTRMSSRMALGVLTKGRPCEVTFLPRYLLSLRPYLTKNASCFVLRIRGVILSGFPMYAQRVVATPLAVDQCRLAVAGDPNSPLCRRAATALPTRSPRFIRASSSASQMAASTHLMTITAFSINP